MVPHTYNQITFFYVVHRYTLDHNHAHMNHIKSYKSYKRHIVNKIGIIKTHIKKLLLVYDIIIKRDGKKYLSDKRKTYSET